MSEKHLKESIKIEFDENVQVILGMPNFQCGPMAHRLRSMGHSINEKAEDEQAYVLFWLLGLYVEFGVDYRRQAVKILRDNKE